MNADSRLWITDNNIVLPVVGAVGATLLGSTATIFGFIALGAPDSNHLAALGIATFGLCMLGLGLWVLVAMPRETTTIDPVGQRITVTKRTRFGENKIHVIRFNQVAVLHVDKEINSEAPDTFHVAMNLGNGDTVNLFAHLYDGRKERHVAEQRCQRLGEMILAAHPHKAATLFGKAQPSLMDRLKRWSQDR